MFWGLRRKGLHENIWRVLYTINFSLTGENNIYKTQTIKIGKNIRYIQF
jgi:hypothetical protein